MGLGRPCRVYSLPQRASPDQARGAPITHSAFKGFEFLDTTGRGNSHLCCAMLLQKRALSPQAYRYRESRRPGLFEMAPEPFSCHAQTPRESLIAMCWIKKYCTIKPRQLSAAGLDLEHLK